MPKSVWIYPALPLTLPPLALFSSLFLFSTCSSTLLLKNEQKQMRKLGYCDTRNRSWWRLQLLRHVVGKEWASKTDCNPDTLGLEGVGGRATSFTNKSLIDLKCPQRLENQKEISVCWLVHTIRLKCAILVSSQSGQLVTERDAWQKTTLKPGRLFYNYYLIHTAAAMHKFTGVLTVRALHGKAC